MAVGLVIFGSKARKFWNRAGLLQPEDMSDLPSPGSESPCQGQGQSARRPPYTEVLRQCPEGDKEASDHGSVSLPKVLGTFDCFFSLLDSSEPCVRGMLGTTTQPQL